VTYSLTLPDGRELAYEEYGDPGGTPVFSFHGGLSSRLDAAPASHAASSLGVRLISPDRPGMGRSTYLAGRRLVDWPADVAALADALGLERFAVMGWSAGGPYAAACAALQPERVTAAALLSSSVPIDVFGTTRGLTSDDRILLFLVRHAPAVASFLMKATIGNVPDSVVYQEVRRSFPAPDRAALDQRGSPSAAVAFVKEAMRQGTAGCVQDYRIFGAPWGFNLESIAVPVQIWEGTEDHTGPPEYRQFLLDHIPQAVFWPAEGEGHMSLLANRAGDILRELLSSYPAKRPTASPGMTPPGAV
jgi:pimeloyl-ACP methyl ester carboxylesterase